MKNDERRMNTNYKILQSKYILYYFSLNIRWFQNTKINAILHITTNNLHYLVVVYESKNYFGYKYCENIFILNIDIDMCTEYCINPDMLSPLS